MGTEGWAGIDVSAEQVVIAIEDHRGRIRELAVANDATGHRAAVQALRKTATSVTVCLEATGVYHLDLTLALHRTPSLRVMVANPRTTKDFARAGMRRSKTDRVDARMLLEFGKRMPFRAGTAPSTAVLNWRALARRIEALVQTRMQEKHRIHAATRSREFSPLLVESSRAHMAFLAGSIRALTAEACTLIRADAALARRFDQLLSVGGIGQRSAIRILAELAVLPADMTARQWVAHSGLDPRQYESGTSVHRRPRISRQGNNHLRAALYMPALVAIRVDGRTQTFYEALLARRKRPKQAIVAVMRKLLHAIFGMFLHDALYDSTKCYPHAV